MGETGVSPWVVVAVFAAAYVLYQVLYALATAAVARRFGVGVGVVSVGFGARLVGFRVGRTEFRLSLVPTGCYLQFVDAVPGAKPEPSTPDWRPFSALAPWRRIVLGLAGPLANALAGLLILTGSWVAGRQEPAFLDEAPRVAWCRPDSAFARGGLAPGDVVAAVVVDGVRTETPTWRALVEALGRASSRTVALECRRGDESPAVAGASETSAILDVCHVVPGTVYGTEPARPVVRPGLDALAAAWDDVRSELPILLRALRGSGEFSRARVADNTGYRGLVLFRYAVGFDRAVVAAGLLGVLLCALNLLPVPTLNGGQIAMDLFALAGRPLSAGRRERATYVGLAVALVFYAYLSYRAARVLWAYLFAS